MPKPTIPEILTEFEAEIARAPRFCSVDRSLLQRLIDDHRRLSAESHAHVCGVGGCSQAIRSVERPGALAGYYDQGDDE